VDGDEAPVVGAGSADHDPGRNAGDGGLVLLDEAANRGAASPTASLAATTALLTLETASLTELTMPPRLKWPSNSTRLIGLPPAKA
jgi:hypothetical protein